MHAKHLATRYVEYIIGFERDQNLNTVCVRADRSAMASGPASSTAFTHKMEAVF